MSAQSLLEELRRRDVRVEAEGDLLRVDAPAGIVTEELRATLTEHKPKLLKLLKWEGCKLAETDTLGLVIRWSKTPGWIALRDPTDGSWHELKVSECLPGIVEAANAHRQKMKEAESNSE
jgi:hypothetical protein